MSITEWAFVRHHPEKCCTEVGRGDTTEPCDNTAYAVAFDAEGYWPVCIHHARGQALATLAEILAFSGIEARL